MGEEGETENLKRASKQNRRLKAGRKIKAIEWKLEKGFL